MLILIVLLQQGKGADMGATFGGGGNTLFGASGADNLLTRVTTITAFFFMCTSVYLAHSAQPGVAVSGNLFKDIPAKSAAPLPVTEVPAAPENNPAPAAGQTSGETTAAPEPEGAAAQNNPAHSNPAEQKAVPDTAAQPQAADKQDAPQAQNAQPAQTGSAATGATTTP
jgi:preprotein translocase subunit SecG